MEQVVKVARTLRVEHRFRGYIHLKTIPEAAPELIAEAGPLGGPHQHQRRAAHRDRSASSWPPRKNIGRIRTFHDRDPVTRSSNQKPNGRESTKAPELRARRSEHADDRRRDAHSPTARSSPKLPRCTGRTGCAACTTRRLARFRARRAGYHSLPRRWCASIGSTRPTGSCASTAFNVGRDYERGAARPAAGHRSQAGVGAAQRGEASPWTSTARRVRCSCGCRAWACATWTASWPCAAGIALPWPTSRSCACLSPRRCRFIVTADHVPKLVAQLPAAQAATA